MELTEESIKTGEFSQQRAEDIFLRHCYLYYVEAKPVITDRVFDIMHKHFLSLYPDSEVLNSVGSSRASDYPHYTVMGRRPLWHELRENRKKIK